MFNRPGLHCIAVLMQGIGFINRSSQIALYALLEVYKKWYMYPVCYGKKGMYILDYKGASKACLGRHVLPCSLFGLPWIALILAYALVLTTSIFFNHGLYMG